MKPCEQQCNSHDCGMHAIVNMVYLCFGIYPETTAHRQDMRCQFLEMITRSE